MQRDYVLRLIEQAAAVLREMLARIGRSAGRDDVARGLRRAASLGGLDLDLLRLSDDATLLQLVTPGGEPEPARTWLAAESLYLDGMAAQLDGAADDARASLAKALLLYQLVQPGPLLPAGVPEAAERVRDIERRLAALEPGSA
ncbi:MAG TPA: hypothetical protein VFH97_02655 [Gemmatimonadales bacterium]|nr:hypothetical protein [Gemmatimonadales bacterium]